MSVLVLVKIMVHNLSLNIIAIKNNDGGFDLLKAKCS